jgi:hypothetical protein
MTAKPDRIPCAVLGCRRTAPKAKYAEGTRIICGKCWRLGSVEARRCFSENRRSMRRLEHKTDDPSFHQYHLAERQSNAAWERVLVEATEAKVGLA